MNRPAAQANWAFTAVLVLFGVLVAVAFGGVAVLQPKLAFVIALAAVGLPLAIWMPWVLVIAGLILFTVSPLNAGFYGRLSEGSLAIQRLLFVGVLLPYAVYRGMQLRWLLPIGVYIVAGMASYEFGLPIEDWNVGQAIRSLISLGVLWAIVAIAWDSEKDSWILKGLALLPVVSVALSVGLSPTGFLRPFGDSEGVIRLQGGMIASYLGGASAVGATAALLLRGRLAWRYASALVGANAVICLATGTRGAILMLLPVLAVAAGPMLSNAMRSRSLMAVMRLLAVFIAVPVVAIGGYAVAAERGSQTVYNSQTGETSVDVSSGRFTAWGQFYDLAEQSILFGRGLGAGPLAQIEQQGYNAQHNEYLRIVLELGYVGGIPLLLSMGWVLIGRVRRGPPDHRRILYASILGFAIFSFTDNTLVVPQVALTFALLIGVGGAPLRRRAPARPTPAPLRRELPTPVAVPGGPGVVRRRPRRAQQA